MKKLTLLPNSVKDLDHHDYSLPFPFIDSEFDAIVLERFDVYSERERNDVIQDIVRVLKPYGRLTFGISSPVPSLIEEAFDCHKDAYGSIVCTHKGMRVSVAACDIGKDYYDSGYFVGDGKVYCSGDNFHKWSYGALSSWWSPALEIAQVWKDMFLPSYAVDCGCGRGCFTKALRDVGVDVVGFDFSEFAVTHPCCDVDDIFQADVTDIPLGDNITDLTLVLDLMEHIYSDEIDQVLSEVARISSSVVFFNIGGIVPQEDVKMLRRGEPIPEGYEGFCAAGHVTYQTVGFWKDKIKAHGLRICDDLVESFSSKLPEDYLSAWNIIITKKGQFLTFSLTNKYRWDWLFWAEVCRDCA